MARRWQWAISAVEEPGPQPRAGRPRGQGPMTTRCRRRRDEAATRSGSRPTRRWTLTTSSPCPCRLLQARRRGAREVAAKRCATCWWTSTRTRTRCSTNCSRALVGERGKFTAVGDDDQSIYGWRGATIDNLQAACPPDYPDAEGDPAGAELPLHRRTSCAPLTHVIAGNNPKLYEKKLWSEFGDGDPVVLLVECRRRGARGGAGGGPHPPRCGARVRRGQRRAVQGRGHPLPRQPPGAHLRAGPAQGAQIPYKVSGGQSFFDKCRDQRPLRLAAPAW